MIKYIFDKKAYTLFFIKYKFRNSSKDPNNIYYYNDRPFTIFFDVQEYKTPRVHIAYFGDTSDGLTYLRVRMEKNRGYLEKIYVGENLRGKHFATDLVDLALERVFPHIKTWNIVGIYPTNEATKFWDSIIARYPQKTFIKC